MSATHATQSTGPQSPVLCMMALELSLVTWKLAFTVGSGQKPRIRSVPAAASSCLLDEIRLAIRGMNMHIPLLDAARAVTLRCVAHDLPRKS